MFEIFYAFSLCLAVCGYCDIGLNDDPYNIWQGKKWTIRLTVKFHWIQQHTWLIKRLPKYGSLKAGVESRYAVQ